MDSTPSSMASFRLMHRQTGAVLPGYRVLSATEVEIDEANHRLSTAGSPMRFVIDLHPITSGSTEVCDALETAHSVPVLIPSNPA